MLIKKSYEHWLDMVEQGKQTESAFYYPGLSKDDNKRLSELYLQSQTSKSKWIMLSSSFVYGVYFLGFRNHWLFYRHTFKHPTKWQRLKRMGMKYLVIPYCLLSLSYFCVDYL